MAHLSGAEGPASRDVRPGTPGNAGRTIGWMREIALLGLLSLFVGIAACSEPGDEPTPGEPTPSVIREREIVELPTPDTKGDVSLEETLARRRSVREFTGEQLTIEELSQLLWAAQGITADWGGRTAPSAGALYPLEVYLVTADGLFHYLPDGHRAERLSETDLRAPLADAAFGQTAVSAAPAVFVITGVYARSAAKYGDRAERYVQLEAGHVCQNLLLQAVTLGLAGVPMGAFSDVGVQQVLGLPRNHVPLYLVPLGHAATGAS